MRPNLPVGLYNLCYWQPDNVHQPREAKRSVVGTQSWATANGYNTLSGSKSIAGSASCNRSNSFALH